MAFETKGEVSWEVPQGYYEHIAESDPNSLIHLTGRMLVAPVAIALFGRPEIVTSPGFDIARKDFNKGNIFITSTHRTDWETVIQPATFERVGLHEARPIAKLDPLFQYSILRGAMHGLGAFAIDKRKGKTDLEGILLAQLGILRRGGIITGYVEGTRITKNPLEVADIQMGAIMAAIINNSLIVPTAFAGLSKEKTSEGDKRRTIARDKPSNFGRKIKLVAAFEDPFRLEQPNFDIDMLGANPRTLSKEQRATKNEYLRDGAIQVKGSMQKALSAAYKKRGNGLEEVFEQIEA